MTAAIAIVWQRKAIVAQRARGRTGPHTRPVIHLEQPMNLDRDAPADAGFWHWAVYNIPASAVGLAQGAGNRRPRCPRRRSSVRRRPGRSCGRWAIPTLSAYSGQTLWSFAAGSSVNAGAVVVDGVVYWGSGYGRLASVFPGSTGNNKFYAFSHRGR